MPETGITVLPVTGYQPDFEALGNNGVNIYIACGQYGLDKNTWYAVANAAKILAGKLSCDFVTFPGHHGSYMDEPDSWAEVLQETIHKAGW